MRTLLMALFTILFLNAPSAAFAQQGVEPRAQDVAVPDTLPTRDIRGVLIDRGVRDLAQGMKTRRMVHGGVTAGLSVGLGVVGASLLAHEPESRGFVSDLLSAPSYLLMKMSGGLAVIGGVGVSAAGVVLMATPLEDEVRLREFQKKSPTQRSEEGLTLIYEIAKKKRGERMVLAALSGVGFMGLGSLVFLDADPVLPASSAFVMLGMSLWFLAVPSEAEQIYESITRDLEVRLPRQLALTPSFGVDPSTGAAHTGLNLGFVW